MINKISISMNLILWTIFLLNLIIVIVDNNVLCAKVPRNKSETLIVKSQVNQSVDIISGNSNGTIDDIITYDDMKLPRDLFDFYFRNKPAPIQRRNVHAYAPIWEKGIVYYTLDKKYTKREIAIIKQGMEMITRNTCVEFKNGKDKEGYSILITKKFPDLGCLSPVGRVTNKNQFISLPPACLCPGIVAHELMHTLGFLHEHQSSDRDKYIDIVTKNIPKQQQTFFSKLGHDISEDFNLPYDYDSIMHYGPDAFSNGHKTTIKPKKKGVKLIPVEKRTSISTLDEVKINKLYCENKEEEPKQYIDY